MIVRALPVLAACNAKAQGGHEVLWRAPLTILGALFSSNLRPFFVLAVMSLLTGSSATDLCCWPRTSPPVSFAMMAAAAPSQPKKARLVLACLSTAVVLIQCTDQRPVGAIAGI